MATLNPNGTISRHLEIGDMNRSYLRKVFLGQDNKEITRILEADLLKYMDSADISRMKFITLDFFIPAFLKKICNVYDTPPMYKMKDGSKVDDEKFTALMEEVKLSKKMSENFESTRLNNTAIMQVKYNKFLDRVFIDNSLQEYNTEVICFDGYEYEWEIIAYKVSTNDADIVRYMVWDRVLHEMYYVEMKNIEELKLTNEMTMRVAGNKAFVGDNEDAIAPDYANGMPFTIYRYKENAGFWGNGMDSLVELVRSINVLLTVANDDTIQESIRLLILNFSPSGVEGESGQLKTGLRHPLFVEEGFTDSDPKGQIVSADLYNDDIIKLIESLTDSMSSMHNVDSVLKRDFKESLSGISLRIKNEPLLRQWGHDIETVRASDIDLIKNVISVNNYHREGNQIDLSILDNIEIDYQEPQVVTDIKEEYDLERQKWEDGTSSPVLYVMRKNPEMTREEAKEYLLENLNELNESMVVKDAMFIGQIEEGVTVSSDGAEA